MGVPIAVGDKLDVVLRYQLAGQTCMNIFHYIALDINTVNPEGGYDVLEESFEDLIQALIMNLLSRDVTDARIRVQRVGPTRAAYRDYIPDADIGQAASDTSNVTTALVITKHTVAAGRQYQGRNFIAGVPEAEYEKGLWSAGVVDDFQLVADNMVSTIISGNWTFRPVIRSGGGGNVNDYLDQCIAQRVARVQRRREVGVGI